MGCGGDAGAVRATDFHWSTDDEPHAARRKQILKKYPEVSKLMGPEPRTKWIVLALVTAQVALSVCLRGASWPVYVLTTYVVGATITHALFLAIHELSHNLGAKRPEANRLISMVANFPILIPYCVTFKQYHIEHHKSQGVDGVDADIPARLEARIFQGKMGKTLWCLSQIGFYALRPMMIKSQTPGLAHAINLAVQIAFDVALVSVFGWAPFRYMAACAILAGSIHPTAGAPFLYIGIQAGVWLF
ncbi:sphingolipid Delta4-desaturase-domain-containing protein [Pavlovales sp. CCMP2436]|nr:sphingolipid Delta4-desaturase-domain-containing protein [Pavlovales sp. CCMP2436]